MDIIGKKELTIIIPAYNEQNRLEKTVLEYINFFQKKPIKFSILIVVNGSTDKTLQIAKKLSKTNPETGYLNFPKKIGKGGAVIKGLDYSQTDYIGFVDADNSITPNQFYKLYTEITNNDSRKLRNRVPVCKTNKPDIVIGSRNINGSLVENKSIIRKILSIGFNTIVNLLFDLNIRDTQCGGKIFTKHSIKKILPDLIITGMAFDVNILTEYKRNNLEIIEIPIKWVDDKGGAVSPFSTSVKMLQQIFELKLHYMRGMRIETKNTQPQNQST